MKGGRWGIKSANFSIRDLMCELIRALNNQDSEISRFLCRLTSADFCICMILVTDLPLYTRGRIISLSVFLKLSTDASVFPSKRKISDLRWCTLPSCIFPQIVYIDLLIDWTCLLNNTCLIYL